MLKPLASIIGPQAMKLSALLLLALLAAGATLSLTQAQLANGVYDTDGDKLIEIGYLEQLDALRYDPNGDGAADETSDAAAYALAFTVTAGQSVCDSGCNGYELAKSLDFTQSGSYRTGTVRTEWTDTTGDGWTPILHQKAAGATKGYGAVFEGNGYTISNLYSKGISTNRNTGLFAVLESTGVIRSLGLLGVNITGGYNNTGALVANNKGTITGSHSTGGITGKGDVGGLVGNNNGSVSNSYSAGTVSSDEDYVGGLAGDNLGTITRSYATGAVSGKKNYVGGLAGYNLNTVTHSYASGAVTGKGDNVGGLLGKNASKVTASYADGAVSGADRVGGLVGDNIGTVSVSYAAGAVSGSGDYVGGLVGDNGGAVRNAYAMGDVSGNTSVGGLIGDNTATVKYAFAASCSVKGQSSTGGLIGTNADSGTTITGSYWDTTISLSASAGGMGKTTTELQTPTGDTGIYANWQSGDEGEVWDFGTASQYPALEADLNADGTATVGEFGRQRWQTGCSGAGAPTPTGTPTITPTPTPTLTPTPPAGTATPTPSGTPAATPAPTCTESITADGTVNGQWISSCASVNNPGAYAKFYTFNLPARADSVSLTLTSTVATYMYLIPGTDKTASPLETDQDATNTPVTTFTISRGLNAGDWIIEATTAGTGVTGNFTLTVSGVAAPPPTSTPTPTPTPTATPTATPTPTT